MDNVSLQTIADAVDENKSSNQSDTKKKKKLSLLQKIVENMNQTVHVTKHKKTSKENSSNPDNANIQGVIPVFTLLPHQDFNSESSQLGRVLSNKSPEFLPTSSNVNGAYGVNSPENTSPQKNNVGPQDSDPYAGLSFDPIKMYRDLQKKIKKLLEKFEAAEKSGHPFDATMGLMMIMQQIQDFGSTMVKFNSATAASLRKQKDSLPNINNIIADKSGAPTQDINPYTGKPELDSNGNPIKVPPEVALKHQLQYLTNVGHEKYELGPDGKVLQPKKINLSYIFYKKNPEAFQSQLSSIRDLVTHLGGTFPPADKNGIVDGSKISIPNGEIKKMWDKVNPKSPGPGKPIPTPDTTEYNAVNSVISELTNGYNTATTTQSTFLKNSVSQYQAQTNLFKNYAQGVNKWVANLVSAQKGG